VPRLSDGLAELPFDSCADEAVAQGEVELGAYALVVWTTGEDADPAEVLDPAQQKALAAYLGNGGRVLLSGAQIAQAFATSTSDADLSFVSQTLRVGLVADDAATQSTGKGKGPFASLAPLSFRAKGLAEVEAADVLEAKGGASACLYYAGSSKSAAGICSDDGHLVVLGFPLESLNTAADRAALIGAVVATL